MASVLLGYVCTLTFTPPASQGKPRAKVSLDIGMPTLTTKAIAEERASIIRQGFQALELAMLAPPGLDPGQSNIAFNTNVMAIYGESINGQLGGAITRKAA